MSFVDLFFFFSSRRRHTRWPRDWSSDVCSSDLNVAVGHGAVLHRRQGLAARAPGAPARLDAARGVRSEERRVGKECRSGGGPDGQKERDAGGKVTTQRHVEGGADEATSDKEQRR